MFIPGYRSSHCICLRPAAAVSDADLLGRFGLVAYRLLDTPPHWQMGRQAAIAAVGDWTVLADDQCYTLWNRPETVPAVASLAAVVAEVFTAFLGDCDDAFGFRYYRDGKLVRAYLAAEPDAKPGEIFENIGPPLPGEAAPPGPAGRGSVIDRVAAALGIPSGAGPCPVRVYGPAAKVASPMPPPAGP